MKLSLKNIGKIKKASIEINGITVIAGENNTGKSTVGKALYSVFNSLSNIDEQIWNEKVQSIENILSLMYRKVAFRLTSRVDFEELACNIIRSTDKYENWTQLKSDIWKMIEQYDPNFDKYKPTIELDEMVDRIYEVLQISNEEFFKIVLEKKFGAEFNGQINNIYTEGNADVSLQIKDETVDVTFYDNEVCSINKKISLKTEVLYFDDPFILDEQRSMGVFRNRSSFLDHRTHLKSKLYGDTKDSNVIDEIVINNKFERISDRINEVCDGSIVRARRNGWGYKKANTDEVLDVRNLSTGLKTFVILKTLLANGIIEYNGTIILDEPEIHLHPEWQLLFAELIVLIHKEFGVHILLNTHSPYFLNAIEVYAKKYDVSDKCKYYLAVMDGESSCLDDVTNNIEKIYCKLARPLQELENERYKND